VSRVAVGTIGADFPEFVGTAQDIDVGNFKTDDEAAAAVDWFAGALGRIGIDPSKTVIDTAGVAFGTVIAHEMGHLLGCYHTDQPSLFEGRPNLMDGDIGTTLGPDFVFGTRDDVDVQLGVDAFASNEQFEGVNDTLNTVAFGLSTGMAGAVTAAAPAGSATAAASAPIGPARIKAVFVSIGPEEDELLAVCAARAKHTPSPVPTRTSRSHTRSRSTSAAARASTARQFIGWISMARVRMASQLHMALASSGPLAR